MKIIYFYYVHESLLLCIWKLRTILIYDENNNFSIFINSLSNINLVSS